MTRNRILPIALIAVLAVGVGGYLLYDQFLRGDNVAPLAFASPSPSTSAQPTASPDESTDASTEPSADPATSATTGTTTGSATAGALAGTWRIGDGSVAGYRVLEKLANLPAQSDAVGRTESITGEATLVAAGEGVEVSAAQFEVDLTTLTSDDGRRDNRLRQLGIESGSFPTSTFVLTQPLAVPAAALTGATVDVTLVGDLDLHGVTRAVQIPAQARLVDGRIEVLGSLTFPFADFGMTPPSVGGFVTVEDDATLEFLIMLDAA